MNSDTGSEPAGKLQELESYIQGAFENVLNASVLCEVLTVKTFKFRAYQVDMNAIMLLILNYYN